MSIMELDPPDYWLIVNDDSGILRVPMTFRAWLVAPLVCPNGDQVVLARVDPPYWVYRHGDQDFVVLRPETRRHSLHPVRPGATCVQICRYSGHYQGQMTAKASELEPDRRMVAFGTEGLAQQAEAYLQANRNLPLWARDRDDSQTRPSPGCLMGIWSLLGR